MTARMIYVACLAAYNQGDLHGRWIEATDASADCIREEIAAMLKASPVPNAEEWAIHDTDGFANLVGEYTSPDDVAAIAEALEGGNGLGLRYLMGSCGYSLADALDKAEEVSWTHESPRDHAESLTRETGGLEGIPDAIANYVDWEGMARDWLLSGDICEYDDAEEGRVTITNASAC